LNLWKIRFEDDKNEIEITLLIKSETLDSALAIGSSIAEKKKLQLKSISQMWIDMRGRGNIEERKINAF